MLMQWRCGARLNRVDQESDPSGAEISVGQNLPPKTGAHEHFGDSLMIDNGHMSLLSDFLGRAQNDAPQVLSALAPWASSRSVTALRLPRIAALSSGVVPICDRACTSAP